MANLLELARGIGLGPIHRYSDLAKAEAQTAETPLVFFLFAATDDVRRLKPLADAIRFSPGRRLRFSPLIYFARGPSIEAIRSCINMGFDDVIALPYEGPSLEHRIAQQIGQTCVFYETSTYFGPDRRNRLETDQGDPRRGSGGQFRRMEIIRTPDKGVEVLREDLRFEL